MSFEQYGLSENPFLAADSDFPFIDRTGIVANLGRGVQSFVDGSSPGLLAVLGDYGLGKTALLRSIAKRIKDGSFLPVAGRPVRVAFMKALPPDPTPKYTLYLYRAVVRSLGVDTFLAWKDRAMKDDHGRFGFGVPEPLRVAGENLSRAITALGTASRPGLGWAYIEGDKLSSREQAEIGVDALVDSNERAQAALIDILRLAKTMGEGGLVVLVDEWEYLFTAASPAKGLQAHTAIKDLYDRIRERRDESDKLASVVFVLACTPLAWETNIPSILKGTPKHEGIEPFAQRIAGTFNLKPLSETDTTTLVSSRLDARRRKGAKGGVSPFNEDALKAIYRQTLGAPRQILGRCAFLLEQGVLSGKETIDGPFAEDVLRSYQFPVAEAA